MANSSTKNELGKFLVSLALDKIESWASTELTLLKNNVDFPICLQLSGSSWAIGNYYVTHMGQNRWRVTHDDELIHVFYSRQASMFYPVFMILHYYKTADNLLKADREAAKLSDEMQFYSAKLAKNNHDSFKQQLWEAKYINARAKYRYAKSDLEKTLNSAKYCKIWEKIL